MRAFKAFVAISLSLFLCILAFSQITLDEVKEMSRDESADFFRAFHVNKLSDSDDFFDVLITGLASQDDEVRSLASMQAMNSIIGLQRIANSGVQLPIKTDSLPLLQQRLVDLVDDPAPTIRTPAVIGLIYSDAESDAIMEVALERYYKESSPRIRAEILKAMGFAGYRSAEYEAMVLVGLSDESHHVREQAAQMVGLTLPEGALDQLVSLLSDDEMARDYVVDAIASYGYEARVYLEDLKRLLNSPSAGGTLPLRIKRAITEIETSASAPSVHRSKYEARNLDMETASEANGEDVASMGTGAAEDYGLDERMKNANTSFALFKDIARIGLFCVVVGVAVFFLYLKRKA